ncbi:MAG: L-erythro-3,5-diaminohexanoate dehydrogenase [Candidatus Eremiobacteraeota bacterium]|nr:L-erythro-3,5-diaminohexanoate dehydrogenase [Candidatus Eremiobacteraeota bacterium]
MTVELKPAAPALRPACRFGTHRVLEPAGDLPQTAWRLDNTPRARENEILCRVEALSLDSASFRQIREAAGDDRARIAQAILSTVAERGKMHNPVTGSGGIFIGTVAEIGEKLQSDCGVSLADRVASLVSLTLTPLALERVRAIDLDTCRVDVDGVAILFACAQFARLPDDLPEGVTLAALDVAGAPAQVRRLALSGQTILVMGADGKSGLLACAQARDRVGPGGRVVGVGPDATTPGAVLLQQSGLVDAFIAADARNTTGLLRKVADCIPALADLVVNCVNVPGTELASIMCARDGGTVYFFSMCTSFTAAALGAEGVGKDVTMIVGNGYAVGHAEIALATLREHPRLLTHFTEIYAAAK